VPRYSHYLYLMQAYDRLGEHLYGSLWTGNEFDAFASDTPDELHAKRKPLETRLAAIADELEACRKCIASSTSSAVVEDEQRRQTALFEERTTVQIALSDELPRLDDRFIENHKARERREFVKGALIRAFVAGELHPSLDGGMLLEMDKWKDPLDYRLWFGLSLATLSPRVRHGRRASVLIHVDEFERLLLGQKPLHEADAPETRAKRSFIEWFRSQIPIGRQPKQFFEGQARERFGVSLHAFRQIWAMEAPAEWQQKGRIKGRKTDRQ